MQRILIVKLSAIGDIVHTLPALRVLREARSDYYLGWAVHQAGANLLEGHPLLNEVIIVPREWSFSPFAWGGLKKLLRGRTGDDWDIAIDFQGLTKSGFITWMSGARDRIGFEGLNAREWNTLFTNEQITTTSEHVIGMNLELLKGLRIVPPKTGTALIAVFEEDRAHIREWADSEGIGEERFAILDPFAGWPTKTWLRSRWVELAQRIGPELGMRCIVVWGPKERDAAQELRSMMKRAGAETVLAPPTTLRQFAALADTYAAVIVAGDTGLMHLAAARGVPAVALYGPSDPRRNGPAFSNAHFQALQDPSQPCANTFWRECKHHDPGQCLSGIEVDQVLQAIPTLMGKAQAG